MPPEAVRFDISHGFQAVLFSGFFRHHNYSRCGIGNSRGIAGGNSAVLLEGRRQFAQSFHGALPGMLIDIKKFDFFFDFDLNRDDLLLEGAVFGGRDSSGCCSRQTAGPARCG